MKIKAKEIKKLVGQFMQGRDSGHRQASFDYCFNYFHSKKDFASKENLQISCLHLGFYLASWGMYRGSCVLPNYSAKQLERVIEIISKWDQTPLAKIWKIDADKYGQPGIIECLCNCYKEIEVAMTIEGNSPTVTLVAKIMLGIFGCIPGFDSYFTATFRCLYGKKRGCAFRECDEAALEKLGDFYNDKTHKKIIDKLAKKYKTLDFATGKPTGFGYTRAKIIDMIGFQKEENEKKKSKK